ncbi:hypothetical protein B0H16DRAFT_1481519 [Mycena metata]|uniref:Uncharacterized protein n=1 Tax=Mycena metata TaxID=1033252 RepID=A0AAD7GYH8_9AGAR|nr:hypothetical protein B0H16DRAFT_1481519 [Mycena metata]
MAAMHGTNGLLQVMAALSWWGKRLLKQRDGPEWPEWIAAVEDLTWVLDELLDSGEIGIAKAGAKRKRGGAGSGSAKDGMDRGKRQKRTAAKRTPENESGTEPAGGDWDEEGRVLRGRAVKGKEQGQAVEKTRPKPRPLTKGARRSKGE